jgi:hypothetical protein
MVIGIIIPTRGDRPQFLQHALYLISQQSHKPDFIEVVDDTPFSKDKDISWRYKLGCERLIKKGADLIFFWEDDDWYSSDYIKKMALGWQFAGKPKIFGLNSTIYYHIGIKKWFSQIHNYRASAMSTIVTNDISSFKFPPDNEPFLDLWLWKKIPGKAIAHSTINIGIKHGHGLCGGSGHSKLEWYKNNDSDMSWLKSIVDPKSFEFYENFSITPLQWQAS